MDLREAKDLQGEIMRLAHEMSGKLTREALRSAADQVAAAHGYTNGTSLQSTIGKEFQKMKRSSSAPVVIEWGPGFPGVGGHEHRRDY